MESIDTVVYHDFKEFTVALELWLKRNASLCGSHLWTASSSSATQSHPSMDSVKEEANRLAKEHMQKQSLLTGADGGQSTSNHSSGGSDGGGTSAQSANLIQQDPDMPFQGRRFSIPLIWRRIAAELIDYLFLIIVKIVFVMCCLHRDWNLLNVLEKVDLDFRVFSPRTGILSSGGAAFSMDNLDSNVEFSAMDLITPEVLMLEMINRVFVTLYEAVCLTYFGSTLGKFCMGMEVVSCQDIVDLPGGRIEAIPGARPTFMMALLRSSMKNILMVSIFPTVLVPILMNHYRGFYDTIANTIVVCRPSRVRRA